MKATLTITPMKLWQLHAVMDKVQPICAVAELRSDWRFIGEWAEQFNALVETQDRAKLDYELPDDFVRLVLMQSNLTYYLSKDGWLRSYRMSSDDEALSTIAAFKYGGFAIEDAFEKGCIKVWD